MNFSLNSRAACCVLSFMLFSVAHAEINQEFYLLSQAPEPAGHTNYSLAIALLNQGRWEAAAEQFSLAISSNPASADGYYGRAVATHMANASNWPASTIEDLSTAISLDPWFAEAYHARAAARLSKRDLNGAVEDATQAIKIRPVDALFRITRAKGYSLRNEPERAIAELSAAILCDTNNPIAFDRRGVEFLKKGEDAQALEDFKTAVRLDPKQAEPYFDIANILFRKSNFESAVGYYSNAISLEPGWQKPYMGRAKSRLNLSQWGDAILDLSKVLEIDSGNVVARQLRAYAYQENGEIKNAFSDYNIVLRAAPLDFTSWHNRGLLHIENKHWNLAIADLKKALEIRPDFVDGHEQLAKLLATCPDNTLRDGKQALELTIKLIKLRKTGSPHPQDLETLAAAYAEMGRFSEAVEYQSKALGSSDASPNEKQELQRVLQLYQNRKRYAEL